MEELISIKSNDNVLRNRYTFAVTDDVKHKLDELKTVKLIDVNEMLRKFAEKLIQQADQQSA